MKKFFLSAILFSTIISFSQTYQPTWESLDSRPVPQWFKDAKFGIFIHWGVYAVPAYCTKGNYAEWYQNGLENGDSARIKFHKEKFGNRTYYDLANDFKAELFNPDEWARVFEQSGAKYIVLTSKHHDGFCLWPSKDANRDWGFPWNAIDVGPKRDLLGDLFNAVRKTSVHPGMYYSLYEWFNPIWKADKNKYAMEHAWPQMKDLINTYKPDVFWTDGDWEVSEDVWKSKEFLKWMYNESPVKDKVVTYDRWGGDVRFHHGAVFTPEYQPDLDFEDHYWEESRGMGYSYGYNREEDAWDYNSSQSLVLHLIDKVSRGGNFLLDIGPDEHGKIPPIMQERLLQMGEWLKINGEAIYGTSRWKVPSQWSEGKKDYKARGGDVMLKLTVDPDPGYAVKEVFYTYNANTNSLYAIFPKYPNLIQTLEGPFEDRVLVLKDINLSSGSKVEFLSTKQQCPWENHDNDVKVYLPDYDPNQIKTPYAYVVKINNYGKFTSKPQIKTEYKPRALKPLITITAETGTTIYYTIDGKDPTTALNFYTGSPKIYSGPFVLNTSSVIKAIAFYPPTTTSSFEIPSVLPSAVSAMEAKVYDWMPSVKAFSTKPGIIYQYYEPDENINMNTFYKGPMVQKDIAKNISVDLKRRKDKFGFDFYGYIKIDKDGIYTFFTDSDDGSKLFIDGVVVVDNDGDHGTVEKNGKAALKKGYHTIRVMYFDSGGGNELKAFMQPEGRTKEEIPANILFH